MNTIIKFITLGLILFPYFLTGQDMIQFRTNKTYCLINFLQTMKGANGTSPTLRAYAIEQIPKNDTNFKQLINSFAQIELHYNFTRQQFPANRHRNRSTQELIFAAAARSSDIDDFSERIVGILPFSDQLNLIHLMRAIEPYYDKMVWKEAEKKLHQQIKNLEKNKGQVNLIFDSLISFYNSSLSNETSFIVTLYPIPGKKGITTAQPHGNVLAVGILTDAVNSNDRMPVVIHEMAHVVYNEQVTEFQHELENFFLSHASVYNKVAYSYFDEALATACGNGWAYKKLNGQLDTTNWYNNNYIDGFAQAIYPIVENYIAEGKQLDTSFINASILQFEQSFPKAIYDFNVLFNEIHLYHDAEELDGRNTVRNAMSEYFRCNSFYTSTPILHQNSISSMDNTQGTQVIILHDNFEDNMALLKKQFPEIVKWIKPQDKQFMLSFYDQKKRPVILLKVEKLSELQTAFASLKKQQYILPDAPYVKIQ